jgi:twitching motility protein PilT
MHIDELLTIAVNAGSSDLHLKAGAFPTLRIDGELVPQEQMNRLAAGDTEEFLAQAANEAVRKAFAEELEADFAYQSGAGVRFRINACLQEGSISLAFRPVRTDIPGIEELGLPAICRDLVLKPSGLVVVTGPTGCGKSTTLAAMINHLNQTKKRRIVTIEDPAEFAHQDNKCMFSQRELGRDTRSFASALKHVLRQDPDVILVGEMRDLETMAAALTAAETGHLVLTTLHTPGTSQAIDRFIDVFPPHQQPQVRLQLSNTLEGIIYQVLLPHSHGRGRVAAVEVLLATSAVRNLIREGKTHQLPNAIQTGGQYGMQSLNQSLRALCQGGMVSPEEALARSTDVEELKQMLGGH